jgi:hypothetical protein
MSTTFFPFSVLLMMDGALHAWHVHRYGSLMTVHKGHVHFEEEEEKREEEEGIDDEEEEDDDVAVL